MKLISFSSKGSATLQSLLKAIDPKQNGQHALKKLNNREEGEPVETFDQPHIVFDTPSSAVWTSPGTIASYSGMDSTLTTQSDVHAAAAHTASWVSGQTTSLYTHSGELQAIAANGDLSLRAHTDGMELLADGSVTVISVNGEITIFAKERIEMVAGDSKIVLAGANIDFITPGTFTVKAAGHAWAGGASGSAELPTLPSRTEMLDPPEKSLYVKYDEQVVFKDSQANATEGRLRYAVVNTNDPEQISQGDSPKDGKAARLSTQTAQPLEHQLRYAKFKFDV